MLLGLLSMIVAAVVPAMAVVGGLESARRLLNRLPWKEEPMPPMRRDAFSWTVAGQIVLPIFTVAVTLSGLSIFEQAGVPGNWLLPLAIVVGSGLMLLWGATVLSLLLDLAYARSLLLQATYMLLAGAFVAGSGLLATAIAGLMRAFGSF